MVISLPFQGESKHPQQDCYVLPQVSSKDTLRTLAVERGSLIYSCLSCETTYEAMMAHSESSQKAKYTFEDFQVKCNSINVHLKIKIKKRHSLDYIDCGISADKYFSLAG